MSSIRKKQLTALDNASSLTDHELRDALKDYGQSPGPITDSTRILYRKKLASLMESKDVLEIRNDADEDDDEDTSDEDYSVGEEEGENNEEDDSDDASSSEVDDVDPEVLIRDLSTDVNNLSNTTALSESSMNNSGPNHVSRAIVRSLLSFFALIISYYLYSTNNLPRTKSLTKLVSISLMVLFFGYIFLKLYKFFKRRRDEESRHVCSLVHEALEILQSPDNPKGQPLPILHIRDSLMTPAIRNSKRMIKLWEKAVKFMEEHESRVKVEIVNIDGEDFRAWKWIGVSSSASPRKA